MSTTAFASGFTDMDSIGSTYIKAVEQMTAKGVLNGFPDGSFRPKGTLTREQGAKIIAYMILGDGVNALTCKEAPFTDVAADRWSAPCIAWCVKRQILLGYGDGRYGPEDTMTGDQFAKMLLCALGLARDGNYVGIGALWYSAVREDARIANLYDGDTGMATDRLITRQQAALLAWNAVKAAETAEKWTTSPEPLSQQSETPTKPEIPAEPGTNDPGESTETPKIETGDNGDILLPEVP